MSAATPYCSCDDDYSGPECELWSCFGVDNTNPFACGDHGSCIAPDLCRCDSAWAGPACDEDVCTSLFTDGFESGDLSFWALPKW